MRVPSPMFQPTSGEIVVDVKRNLHIALKNEKRSTVEDFVGNGIHKIHAAP